MAGALHFSSGRLGDKYRIGAKLGHGHFGVVREVTEKATGHKYAMKVIMKRAPTADAAATAAAAGRADLSNIRLHREIELSLEVSARSGGIVRTVEAFEDENRVYIVMELARGGTLAEYIDQRREAWRKESAEARDSTGQTWVAFEKLRDGRREKMEVEAGWVLAELASALAAVHESGVVHRDMKPENVLITEDLSDGEWISGLPGAVAAGKKPQKRSFLRKLLGARGGLRSTKVGPARSSTDLASETSKKQPQQVKIADFGLAERIAPGGSADIGFVGSPAYVAPEVVQGSPVGFASDVWGLGVILYFLLSDGRLPFTGRSTAMLLKNIRRANIDLNSPALVGASYEAKAVLARLLAANPAERPTAAEVAEMAWVKEQVQKRMSMLQQAV